MKKLVKESLDEFLNEGEWTGDGYIESNDEEDFLGIEEAIYDMDKWLHDEDVEDFWEILDSDLSYKEKVHTLMEFFNERAIEDMLYRYISSDIELEELAQRVVDNNT